MGCHFGLCKGDVVSACLRLMSLSGSSTGLCLEHKLVTYSPRRRSHALKKLTPSFKTTMPPLAVSFACFSGDIAGGQALQCRPQALLSPVLFRLWLSHSIRWPHAIHGGALDQLESRLTAPCILREQLALGVTLNGGELGQPGCSGSHLCWHLRI